MDHSPTPAGAVAFPAGLSAIAHRYNVILCDVWGVLHNGIVAAPGASDALMRFRAVGGRVVLISNAPRPGMSVVPQLDRLGVPRTAFDAIVTSGDITRAAVAERAGQPLLHLGPERDLPIYEGLPVRFADVDEAGAVICTGLYDDDEDQPEDYRPLLERLLARDVEMICANPDLVVERGHELIPCAGAIAALYESMGGRALYAGKPHRPIYEAALAEAARLDGGAMADKRRVLGVGDAIRTDVAGAVAFGVDALFVARGIHTHELGLREGPLEQLRALDWLARQTHRPQMAIDQLVW